MTDTIKFTFDTEFEDLDEAERQLRLRPPVDPADEPKHSDNQLAAAREQAYAEGVEAGVKQAREEGEYIASTALTAVSQEMERINGVHETIVRDAHTESIGLALIIARKLATELLARFPVPEIESVIKDLMVQLGELTTEPKVVVRVDPNLVQLVNQQIETLKSQSGFDGQITVVGEIGISGSDCRVEWAEGGGERDVTAIESEVAAAVVRYIDSVEARWQQEAERPEQDTAAAEPAHVEASPAPEPEALQSIPESEEPVISTQSLSPERVANAPETAEISGEIPGMSDVPEVVEAPEPIAVPEPVEVSEPVDVSEPVYVPEAAETPAAAQDDLPAAEIEIESEVPAAVPTFVDISITNEDVGSSLPPIPSMDDPVEETPASAADNLPWPAITQDEVSEEIGLDAPSTNDAFPSLEDAPPNAESEEPNDEQT